MSDFKRLCEAAHEAGEGELETSRMELVVRAVLMELREVSEAMLDTVDGSLFLANDEQILSPWRSMIDHILSEPAEA